MMMEKGRMARRRKRRERSNGERETESVKKRIRVSTNMESSETREQNNGD